MYLKVPAKGKAEVRGAREMHRFFRFVAWDRRMNRHRTTQGSSPFHLTERGKLDLCIFCPIKKFIGHIDLTQIFEPRFHRSVRL